VAIDFPASPSVGQEYVFAGIVYSYSSQGAWLARPWSANSAPRLNPIFTGDPQAPSPPASDSDNSIATTAWVKSFGYAPIASPVFTGVPQVPPLPLSDRDTSIATTAFVNTGVADGSDPAVNSNVVGQVVTAFSPDNSYILNTGFWANIWPLSLTAGDWDVSGGGRFTIPGGVGGQVYTSIITTQSAGYDPRGGALVTVVAWADTWFKIGPVRVQSPADFVVNLSAYNATAGQIVWHTAGLWARRAR
jgi:hypothetical protein